MADRTYSPFDIIALPRVDANGAIALAKAVEAAAGEQKDLPATLHAALKGITSCRDALQKAKGGVAVSIQVRDADRAEDDAACALYALLSAWARLSAYIPEGKMAQALSDRLFGDGVGFVNYKVEQEWAVVDSLLKVIVEEGLEANLIALGAAPMLTHLKAVHTTYGEAIGMTKTPAESAEVGQKRDDLLDAMRFYVLRVAGMSEPGDAAGKSMAGALLRPIVAWRTEKPQAKGKGAGEPSPGGDAKPPTETPAEG
jgi:hypothetical protein